MNCWPSGKYVHLLYMYSILGRGSFCFNYCLNSAWHGGDQFVALLSWLEAQVSLTVAFSSSAFFGLLFLIFLLTIPHRSSMAGVPNLFYSGAPLLLRSILQGPPMPDISSYTVLLQQREKCLFLNHFFINQNICFALLFF